MSVRRTIRIQSARPRLRLGFSLVEVLMAVLILGVGVISIAALFPAGIAQQRQSTDDSMGPLVANVAMSVLRSKIKPEMFSAYEDFTPGGASQFLRAPRYTIDGDWPWTRPGFLFEDDGSTNFLDERGAIDIFSWYDSVDPGAINNSTASEWKFSNGYSDGVTMSDPQLFGVPWRINGNEPPRVIVSREERWYPQGSQYGGEFSPPQYVWECMFRRFEGRIQVALFVYRVSRPGSAMGAYTVPRRSGSNPQPDIPPLPIWMDLSMNGGINAAWDATGPDLNVFFAGDNAFVDGTPNGGIYDPGTDELDAWMEPGQILLDQNGSQHRVLSRFDDPDLGDVVELVRPIAQVPLMGPASNPYSMPYFIFAPSQVGNEGFENVVTDVWYLPQALDGDGDGIVDLTLRPVYVTVKDL